MGRTRSILDHMWGAEEPGYGLPASKILNELLILVVHYINIFEFVVYAHVEDTMSE